MNSGLCILGLGMGSFVAQFVVGISIMGLQMGGVIDRVGGPPAFIWIWMIASIWVTVAGGIVCSIAVLRRK